MAGKKVCGGEHKLKILSHFILWHTINQYYHTRGTTEAVREITNSGW